MRDERLSGTEFERRVRGDDRFLTSKAGYEEGFSLYNMLNEAFTGKAA